MDKFGKTVNTFFFLTYGAENHEVTFERIVTNAYSSVGGTKSLNWYEWGWGIILKPTPLVKFLTPNQTVYGTLYFRMGEYYSINELQCRKGGQTNPIFTVDLRT
jgi:hypothetical protein